MDEVPSRIGNAREEPDDELEGGEGLGALVVVDVAGPVCRSSRAPRPAFPDERCYAWTPGASWPERATYSSYVPP